MNGKLYIEFEKKITYQGFWIIALLLTISSLPEESLQGCTETLALSITLVTVLVAELLLFMIPSSQNKAEECGWGEWGDGPEGASRCFGGERAMTSIGEVEDGVGLGEKEFEGFGEE